MATRQLKRNKDFWCTQIQGTRDYQEDDSGFDDSHPGILLMLLADGMGGYAGGGVASQKAVEVFADSFKPSDESGTPGVLDNALTQVTNAIANTIVEKPDLSDMGCTFVGAVLSNENSRIHWISVGDSPFWVFRNDSLIRLNTDHSKRIELEERVRRGEITVEEAASNSERNGLTSALTGEPPALVDNNSRGVAPGDILLLASDGLFTLSDREIEKKLSQSSSGTAEDIVNKLLGSVKKKKKAGQDNTTVLIVKIPNELDDSPPSEQTSAVSSARESSFPIIKYALGAGLLLLGLGVSFYAGNILSNKGNDSLNKVIETHPKEPTAKKVKPEEPATKKVKPEEPATKKVKPEELATKKVKPEELATKKVKPEELATKKVKPEEPATKKIKPEEPATKKVKPEEPATKKVKPEEPATKKAKSEESATKKVKTDGKSVKDEGHSESIFQKFLAIFGGG